MFHHYSGRSAPIFKQASGTPLPGESFGLPLESEQAPGQPPEPSENQTTGLPGQSLNTLDVELTAGLEAYLPTPMFRLRVARGRLREEIDDLREQLAQYDRLPGKSPDMLERVNRIQARLEVLESREEKIGGELSAMLPLGKWLIGLFQAFGAGQSQLLNVFQGMKEQLLLRLRGKDYLNAIHTTGELQNLQRMFAARLADPRVSPAELGQILSLYDRLYEQVRRDLGAVKKTAPGS